MTIMRIAAAAGLAALLGCAGGGDDAAPQTDRSAPQVVARPGGRVDDDTPAVFMLDEAIASAGAVGAFGGGGTPDLVMPDVSDASVTGGMFAGFLARSLDPHAYPSSCTSST